MYSEHLRRALPRVREQLAAAAERSGRDGDSVTIVAVTKAHPLRAVTAAVEAGLRDVGENRVQELEARVGEVGREAVRWHLVGHLQRNKARRAVELFDLLHSLDSLRLARRLSRVAEEGETVVPALLQVNVSGEETKGGFEAAEFVDAAAEIAELPGLRPMGVMTMAPFTDDEGVLRKTFQGARALFQKAGSLTRFEARHLSMGMTSDYVIAVEEGSTMVRLGTALFGERPR